MVGLRLPAGNTGYIKWGSSLVLALAPVQQTSIGRRQPARPNYPEQLRESARQKLDWFGADNEA